MESLYQAYQAYERRVERGEFSAQRQAETYLPFAVREPLMAKFGDLLIRAGLKLKRRYTAGKPMAWSVMTGSKQ
jgi:hypothetical protein